MNNTFKTQPPSSPSPEQRCTLLPPRSSSISPRRPSPARSRAQTGVRDGEVLLLVALLSLEGEEDQWSRPPSRRGLQWRSWSNLPAGQGKKLWDIHTDRGVFKKQERRRKILDYCTVLQDKQHLLERSATDTRVPNKSLILRTVMLKALFVRLLKYSEWLLFLSQMS